MTLKMRIEAKVRRRRPDDDQYDDPWPAELRWVSDVNWWEDDVWTGGSVTPFATHAEALADALVDVDEVRRVNEQRAKWDAIEGGQP